MRSTAFLNLVSINAKKLVDNMLTIVGLTADSVAETMRKYNYQGFKGHPTSCPLAKFIRHGIKPESHELSQFMISVLPTKIIVTSMHHDERVCEISLTDACKAFIEAFDADKYPDLVVTQGDWPPSAMILTD